MADFSKYLFHCSAAGLLMTEPRSGTGLSETTKTYLRQLHRETRYNRKKTFSNKYVEKGLQAEEDGITIYSRFKKNFYKKNTERLNNEYLTGEPDLYKGKDVRHAVDGTDIKCSWDLWTFPYPGDKLDKMYFWQDVGYMALTGASHWITAYCLINTPETLIQDEERKLFYKMNAGTFENPDYIKACEALRSEMTFDDIPVDERIIEFPVERNEHDIAKLYARVIQSRAYLNELEETHKTKRAPLMIASYNIELQATIIETA